MKQDEQTTVITTITDYLQREVFCALPEHLYYHNIGHTMNDVLPASIHLASLESLSSDDLFILKTSALFHDTGFIRQYPANEEFGAQIAGEVLPGFGYSKNEIQRISNIILATRISPVKDRFVQSAGDDPLEKIICDADLDNFGRDDFFDKSANLYREMSHFGATPNGKEWVDYLVFILETHRYYTDSATRLRADGQTANLAQARKLLPTS